MKFRLAICIYLTKYGHCVGNIYRYRLIDSFARVYRDDHNAVLFWRYDTYPEVTSFVCHFVDLEEYRNNKIDEILL